MNDSQKTATKQDLTDLENKLENKIAEVEKKLLQSIEQVETNLLKAFYGYTEATQKHLADLDRSDGSLRERLTTLENRLLEIEKRLNFPNDKP